MTSFHFDLGNSTTGPIGLCAVVKAETEEEALDALKEALPVKLNVPSDNPKIEYIHVYLNSDAIAAADIDDTDEDD